MSRRDTIIVAVLVNAGLLMVLFATATKSKSPKIAIQQNLAQEIPAVEKPISNKIATIATLDELLFETEENLLHELPVEEEICLMPEPVLNTKHLTVTVKQGDTLEKIAAANHTTIASVVQFNNLTSTQLHVGQLLKVPMNDAPSSAPPAIKPLKATEEFYVVKEGDNPWLIASKSKVKLNELLKLNNLDEKTAKRLRPGDRLRIR